MSKTKSANPAYPDAHPTAPGGMSKQALRVELAEKHGVPMDDTRDTKWPDLIDMVIEQRLLREKEAQDEASRLKKSGVKTKPEKTKGKKAKGKKSKKSKAKKHVYADEQAGAQREGPVSGNDEAPFNTTEFSDETFDPDVHLAEVPGEESWPSREAERENALFKMKLPDLKALAKSLKIKGFSTMRKDPLIKVILAAEANPNPVALTKQREAVFIEDATSEQIDAALAHVVEMDLNEVTYAVETLPESDDGVFDPEILFAEIMEARAADAAENPPLFLGIPGIRDYVFDGHAGAGPSASERWMHCTMSVSASRDYLARLSPNQLAALAGGNEAARQGTTAHAVAEVKTNHMLGRIKDKALSKALLSLATDPEEGERYDDEMDEYVNEYVDLIKTYADERGGENILIESRVEAAIPLSGSHEGEVYVIRGSVDAGVLPTEDDPTLVGIDLKYGEGLWVEEEGNTQIMLYLLGLLGLLVDDDGDLTVDIETIRLYVAQPRLGGIRKWELSLDALLDWRDEVLSPALTKALYGAAEGATFEPSESACQFCPARSACPALAESRMAAAQELFEVVTEAEFTEGSGAFPETTSLSDERLGALLKQISGLVDLYPHLKAEAQRRLHRGTPIPGYLLVNYTPPRKWAEGAPEKIKAGKVKLTKEQKALLYKAPDLLTPKQALLALGDGGSALEKLIETPDKRPVIAPVGDRRKPWTGKAPEAMFDDESTPEDQARKVEEMFGDE